jgi:hypothetical protein
VQGADHLHVLPAGELAGEAGRQLQQRSHLGPSRDRALVRDQHSGDELEQRALSGAVAADHADRLAGLDAERRVAHRPELAGGGPAPPALHEQVAQLEVAPAGGEEPDADTVGLDERHYKLLEAITAP